MPKDRDIQLSKENRPSLEDMISLVRSRASCLYPAHPPESLEVVTAKNPDDNRWKAAVIARVPGIDSRDQRASTAPGVVPSGSASRSVVLKQITAFYTLTVNGKPASGETFEKLRHGARPVMVELLLHTLEEELWRTLVDREGPHGQEERLNISEDLPAYKA